MNRLFRDPIVAWGHPELIRKCTAEEGETADVAPKIPGTPSDPTLQSQLSLAPFCQNRQNSSKQYLS
jgi:hypothetical protein